VSQFLAEPLAFFERETLKFLVALFQTLPLLWWQLLPLMPAFAQLSTLLLRQLYPTAQVFPNALLLFRRQITQGFGLFLQPVTLSR
jgi:hypothetical protein